jgi:hypothetical protein
MFGVSSFSITRPWKAFTEPEKVSPPRRGISTVGRTGIKTISGQLAKGALRDPVLDYDRDPTRPHLENPISEPGARDYPFGPTRQNQGLSGYPEKM